MTLQQAQAVQTKARGAAQGDARSVVAQRAVEGPQALQMQALQDSMDESPGVRQLAALSRAMNGAPPPVQRKENRTGLPDGLKAGVESLSGHAMDDVKVHYNSSAPAQLNAHAYAQGTDIHLAPGQESHLPHEAWHVAQQKQGRVAATTQLKGIAVNDDAGLEREADRMGAQALQGAPMQAAGLQMASVTPAPVVQGYFDYDGMKPGKNAAPLISQALKPTPTGAQSGPVVDYAQQQTKVGKAPFLVADDLSLAIHKTVSEPKEFFALKGVVDASNALLAGVQSPVRLASDGADVSLEGKALNRVRPRLAKETAKDGEFAGLWTDICIQIANMIMGNEGQQHEELVLHNAKTGSERGHLMSVNEETAPEVARLARHLTLGSSPTKGAKKKKGKKPDPVDTAAAALDDATQDKIQPGRRYGQALGEGALDERSRAIGVNAFARPEVGEGFATFSVKSGGKKSGTDFSVPGHKTTGVERANTWGYHHAAVVARSTDGNDWITLENYRRNHEADAAMMNVLVARHAQEARAKAVEFGKPKKVGEAAPTPEEVSKQVARYIGNTYYKEAVATYAPIQERLNSLWFFRMYGSHKGQTFHETQNASGAFFNPLTVRVRRNVPTVIARFAGKLDETAQELDGKLSADAVLKWPAARAALQPLQKQTTKAFAAMRAVLAKLGKNATNSDVIAATEAINDLFAGLLKDHLVPRLAEALRATMRGAPGKAPKSADDLKAMAQAGETAGGVSGLFSDLSSYWSKTAAQSGADRLESLTRLREIVNTLPQKGLDVMPADKGSSQSSTGGKSASKLETPEQRIGRFLTMRGLQLRQVPPDGDCLYHAVRDQLAGTGFRVTNGRLRRAIGRLLTDNPAHFGPFLANGTVQDAVNSIVAERNWNDEGGDIAAQAIATVLRRSVVVFSPHGMERREPIAGLVQNAESTVGPGGGALNIAYNGDDHYYSTEALDQ